MSTPYFSSSLKRAGVVCGGIDEQQAKVLAAEGWIGLTARLARWLLVLQLTHLDGACFDLKD